MGGLLGGILGGMLGGIVRGCIWGHVRAHASGDHSGGHSGGHSGRRTSRAIPGAHCKIHNLLGNCYSFVGIYHLRNPGLASGALGTQVNCLFSRGIEVKNPSINLVAFSAIRWNEFAHIEHPTERSEL